MNKTKKRKVLIAPSLLSASFLDLRKELKDTEDAGAGLLHVDIMDGHFVPNMTIGPFVVEAIRKATSLPLDVHLMIEQPERYIDDFISAGADYLTVHEEASVHLNRTVDRIRERGAKAGVSLNPSSPVCLLDSIIEYIDMVLIMSVNPGFGGQSFIGNSLEKIKAVREMINKRGLGVVIEVDGGVKPGNARTVADAGADILVMGSAFYGAGDYKALMAGVRKTLS
ncbi:MAG: ribulose-phosphate 3-epimerase [Nitrospiraceae bacterium]|nr:ribulose-phosphate 3-epimerase [Nitrospiraceae bacterium]